MRPTYSNLTPRVQMWHWLFSPGFLTTVMMQCVGFCFIFIRPPINDFDPAVYMVASVSMASLWFLANITRDALSGLWRGIMIVAGSFAAALIVGVNGPTYEGFGEFLSASMLAYAGQAGGELESFWRYAENYFFFPFNVIVIASFLLLICIWVGGRPLPITRRARRKLVVVLSITWIVTLAGMAVSAERTFLAPDAATLNALSRAPFLPAGQKLVAAKRLAVPELTFETAQPQDQLDAVPTQASSTPMMPNIVLIIHESLGKQGFPLFNGTQEVEETGHLNDSVMPFLADWIKREPRNFLMFPYAYTNTTATKLSVPTILTGVAPYESYEKYHRMPLLWQWARAAGVTPFLVTPKRYTLHGFEDFFFDHNPLPRVTGDTLDDPVVNDFGLDELAVVPHFNSLLGQVASDRPFLGIYNSNAAHEPYQATSRELNEPPNRGSRFADALYILDLAVQDIVESVRKSGRLENTVFIFTADHGQALELLHTPPRIASFYEEVTNLPFAIRVPPAWHDRYPQLIRALQLNQKRLIANVDIVPSIAGLYGFDTSPAHRALFERLEGYDFFETLPQDRVVIVLNNNAIRRWEHTGFGIYFGPWRFLVTDIEGARLFNINRDPKQKHDRWHNAPQDVRQRIFEVIESHPALQAIWKDLDL